MGIQSQSRGFNKSERLSGTLSLTYPLKNTEKVTSSFGLTFIASPNTLIPVVPVFYYARMLNSRYIFEGILPYSLKIKRIINDETFLSVGTFFGGGSYMFKPNDFVDSDYKKTLEWRWAQVTGNLMFEKKLKGMLWASVETGVDMPVLSNVVRPKEVRQDALSDQDIAPSPYLKFSIYLIPAKKAKKKNATN